MSVTHPLSHAQQAQWFLHALAPGSGAYNTGIAVRVRSAVDVRALREAVTAIGPRHGMLRSRYAEADGRPVRVESATSPVRLVERACAGADDEELRAAVRAELNAPFPLRDEVPFRFVLLTRSPEDAVLLVAGHHISTDAVSNTLLLRDLLEAYEELSTGADAPSPPPTADYGDHVDKEARVLDSARGRAMEEYWSGVSLGSTPAGLPTDHPRPTAQSFTGDTLRETVPPELADALRTFALRSGVTSYAVLLGVFQSVLYRHTRQGDFALGVPTTTRLSSRMRDVVGNFMNTVVLRARFGAATTFDDAVRATDEQLKLSMDAVRYPFSLLARASGASRTAGRSPMYQITFNMLATARFDAQLRPVLDTTRPDLVTRHAGLLLSPYHLPQQEGQVDLAVDVLQGEDTLAVDFRYDSRLYERATVERLAQHFLRALDIATRTPDLRVAAARLWDRADVRRPPTRGGAPREKQPSALL
ncbi:MULTISPECIES: condensation domain-containing protein [Streptomyces]|uniref:condensation domain-containing protein n=1 Tax=Streptomyces TaxID=1883 RepID=UPI0004CD6FDD|nr:condensation domain-containing protein [Streptomyces durhamensis]